MNKDNAHEYLPLVQALADGKQLQVPIRYNLDQIKWEDCDEISFIYTADQYRIKPEPRTFPLWINRYTGAIADNITLDRHDHSFWERITVQEVLK